MASAKLSRRVEIPARVIDALAVDRHRPHAGCSALWSEKRHEVLLNARAVEVRPPDRADGPGCMDQRPLPLRPVDVAAANGHRNRALGVKQVFAGDCLRLRQSDEAVIDTRAVEARAPDPSRARWWRRDVGPRRRPLSSRDGAATRASSADVGRAGDAGGLPQSVAVQPTEGKNAAKQHEHCEDQYEHASTRTDPGVTDCELPHTDGASRSV